jgi:hypothetical protein
LIIIPFPDVWSNWIFWHDDPTSIKMLEDLTGSMPKRSGWMTRKPFSLLRPEALGVTRKNWVSIPEHWGFPIWTKFVRQMWKTPNLQHFSSCPIPGFRTELMSGLEMPRIWVLMGRPIFLPLSPVGMILCFI